MKIIAKDCTNFHGHYRMYDLSCQGASGEAIALRVLRNML